MNDWPPWKMNPEPLALRANSLPTELLELAYLMESPHGINLFIHQMQLPTEAPPICLDLLGIKVKSLTPIYPML